MLREGVEAALIVAILLAYLHRSDQQPATRWVWAGTGAALVVSLLTGLILWNTIGGLEGFAEEVSEGVIALLAVALLTWMIFWMGRQARFLRSRLQSQAEEALMLGGGTALALLAFVAVLREGVESVLFMLSTTLGAESTGSQLLGGLLGVLAAGVIGYLFYRGSHLVDLRIFFRVTGVLLILFAAGLVSKGIHELQEAGILPTLVEHLWRLSVLDPDSTTAGRWLASLFGWDPDPSLLMVVGYLAYIIPVGSAFLRLTSAAVATLPAQTEPADPAGPEPGPTGPGASGEGPRTQGTPADAQP
jgi:high-affinity iron transporter